MRVGIIGGGILGLSAAYYLGKRGADITLFEAQRDLGGLCSTFDIERGCYVEKYYRHLFKCDREAIGLMEELGILDKFRFYHSKMGVYYKGKKYPFATPLDLLKFRPLNIFQKMRFALLTAYLGRTERWKHFDRISAEKWILRHAGRSIYEVLWKPLIKLKFGNRYKEIPMTWFWNKINYRIRSRRSGKEMLGYIDGSFKVLVDRLEEEISRKGRVIKRGEVKEIIIKGGTAEGVATEKGNFYFDRIISTVPLPEFIKIAKGAPENYLDRLKQIDFHGVVVLVMKMRKPLGDFYWLNICDDEFPFSLSIEQTNFISPEKYNGNHIAYFSKYMPATEVDYQKGAREIYREWLPFIKRIYPRFDERDVKGYYVFKDKYGSGVPTVNYLRKIPSHTTPVKNLYIATGSQIYPVDRGMSESIRLGKKIAELIH